jgi:hypothetical protein
VKLAPALSLALGLFLAAVGGLAGLSLAREARSTSFGSLSESLDERAARALADVELYRALRDASPQDAPVFFIGDPADAATHLAFSQTEPLVFPRRFYRAEKVPEGWSPGGIFLERSVLVVVYGARRDLDLGPWLEPVSAGARFRLLRSRPEPPAPEDGR